MLCLSLQAQAGGPHRAAPSVSSVRPLSVSAAGTDIFIDLVAADFFESDLRLAQSRQIEAATARRYLALDGTGRAVFREKRRQLWKQMSEQEKAALRGAKRPRFANLDETQKQTFRRIASEELGAGAEQIAHPGDI
ncbi:hypothetical protein ACFOOP_16420 [Marinicaulis aureus]|uniref:Uncharacterized protein n=1 Tax=Hyphococcus aureus TaxID=2666033 RepID=A0ABW1KX93_9PROT